MAETPNNPQGAPVPSSWAPPRSKSGPGWLGSLIALLALAALFYGGYCFWQSKGIPSVEGSSSHAQTPQSSFLGVPATAIVSLLPTLGNSDPKQVALAWLKAVRAGDESTALSLSTGNGSDYYKQYIPSIIASNEADTAEFRLKNAEVKRFQYDYALRNELNDPNDASNSILKNLDLETTIVEGDQALVLPTSAAKEITSVTKFFSDTPIKPGFMIGMSSVKTGLFYLIKINGSWKIDLEGNLGMDISGGTARNTRAVKVLNQLADNIEAGRYKGNGEYMLDRELKLDELDNPRSQQTNSQDSNGSTPAQPPQAAVPPGVSSSPTATNAVPASSPNEVPAQPPAPSQANLPAQAAKAGALAGNEPSAPADNAPQAPAAENSSAAPPAPQQSVVLSPSPKQEEPLANPPTSDQPSGPVPGGPSGTSPVDSTAPSQVQPSHSSAETKASATPPQALPPVEQEPQAERFEPDNIIQDCMIDIGGGKLFSTGRFFSRYKGNVVSFSGTVARINSKEHLIVFYGGGVYPNNWDIQLTTEDEDIVVNKTYRVQFRMESVRSVPFAGYSFRGTALHLSSKK